MQPLGVTIASNIDRLIVASGKTNRQVAELIGSTEHQVWRWRRGKVKPNEDNLAALAGVLADGDLTALLLSDVAA